MPNKSKKMEKKKCFPEAVNMNVNSPVFVPQRVIHNGALHMTWTGYQQYGTQLGGITYYQPIQWVQLGYQLNSMHSAANREYKKGDSVIHNCSQGCHHQKNLKSGSGIGADITTSSHGQQKQAVSSGSKATKGRNSGGTGSINKRHDKNQTHPWLVSSLKGHTDEVRDIDFSSNGKYLASCAEDRTILLWACSQIEDAKNRKSFRINVEYDSATKLAWSPDSKAIAIHKSVENCIEVYKIDKKDGWFVNSTKGLTFPKVTDSDIIGFSIACTGRFIMTCTNVTEMYIWDLRGNILDKIDTYLMNTYSAKISPCGRFIAACGFAPDCKVWEVKFSKTGEYQKTVRVFDLSGHTSGIYDVAFDQDTSHMVTVSKDGTWKLYDTRVEYDKGQSPRLLKTVKYTPRSLPALATLSPNAEVLAIANGPQIELYSTLTGECDAVIKNSFEGTINAISFDSLGKYLFTAGDKQIRIYHNVTGYKTAISVAEAKLKTNVSEATRERLEKQIIEFNDFLKKFS